MDRSVKLLLTLLVLLGGLSVAPLQARPGAGGGALVEQAEPGRGTCLAAPAMRELRKAAADRLASAQRDAGQGEETASAVATRVVCFGDRALE